jgi:glycerophosphoryl diester phosphodiesterase
MSPSESPSSRKPFLIIGHRGVRTDADFEKMAPENTLPAFQQAAEQGASIELDVMLTMDGHVVVHHDLDSGRIFKLPGTQKQISDCSLSEVQSTTLNVNGHEQSVRTMLGTEPEYKTPAQYSDVTIPELETILDAVPNTHVYVELKAPEHKSGKLTSPNHQLEEKITQLIQEKNLYQRVTVIGFSAHSLRKIKARDPNIQTGLNIKLPPLLRKFPLLLPWFINVYVKHWVRADSLQPCYEDTSPNLVKAAHHAGLTIIPWVNRQTREEENALFPLLIGMDVDGLITNAVDLLQAAVAEYTH